eukprot:gene466-34324_t
MAPDTVRESHPRYVLTHALHLEVSLKYETETSPLPPSPIPVTGDIAADQATLDAARKLVERLEASLARQAAAAAAVAAAASVNTPHTKLTAQPALVVSAPKMEVTLSPADFVKQELLRQRYENVGVCTSRGGDVATLGLSASVTSSGSGSGRGGIKHTTRTLPAPCRSSPSPPLPPSPTGLENEGGGFGAPDLLLSDYLWGGGDGGGSSAAGSSVSPPLTAVPLTTGTARTTRATAAGATADPPSLSHYFKVTTASKDYPAITRMLEAAGEYPPSLQDGDGGPVSRSVECSSSLTDDGRCSKSRSSSDSNYGDTASNDDEEAGAAKSSSVRRSKKREQRPAIRNSTIAASCAVNQNS